MPDAGTLRGYARPLFPGASVAVQRFNGSSWRTVARATIDENGSFEARLNLVPGDYRARLAPGRGFVPGVSPTLKVGPGMRRLALAIFLLALAAPGSASAARFAIGVENGADSRVVAQRIEARTGSQVSRIGPFALAVRAPSAASLSSVTGVAWVERIRASRRLMFTPSDPLAIRQWYLGRIHAFDAWSQAPNLAGVRVAVLDSGIDSGHPELQNRIADGKSFVPSSWESDTNGHGTFVAGEIAAALNNAQGIAGVGFSAYLLVAKIVRADGTISPDAEAAAIRWAVDNGARVINMSFGGVRDPRDPDGDTYSPLEAAAVRYAVSKGVLVVAAVGNADNAPTEPWGYAATRRRSRTCSE